MFSFKDWLMLNEGIQDEPYALHAVFMAGTPAAGKSTVAQAMFGGLGFKFADPDQIYERMARMKSFNASAESWPEHPDHAKSLTNRAWSGFLNAKRADTWKAEGLPYVIDITSGNDSLVTTLKSELEAAGYDVFMVWVTTGLDESLRRNRERGMKGREAGEDYTRTISAKLGGLPFIYRNMFGGNVAKPDAADEACGVKKYGNMLVVDNNKQMDVPTADLNSLEFRNKQACWVRWARKLIGPPHTVRNPKGREMIARGTDYEAGRQPRLTEPSGALPQQGGKL